MTAATLGDMVMERLKALDNIAYIRFASVYRKFADITELKQEVDSLVDGAEQVPASGQRSLIPGGKMARAAAQRRRRN